MDDLKESFADVGVGLLLFMLLPIAVLFAIPIGLFVMFRFMRGNYLPT